MRYGIPYLPYEVLELTRYDWKRAEDALVNIPGGPLELNLLWLELFDGIFAHHILAESSRLAGVTGFARSVVDGVLRITRGSPIEGPSGESCPPQQHDDPAAYIALICKATVALAKELTDAASELSDTGRPTPSVPEH